MLSEPQQILATQPLLQLRTEENRQANKIHSHAREEPREVLAETAEIHAQGMQVGTPPGPGDVGFWERGEPEPDEHEDGGHEASDPGAGVDEVERGLVVGEVGEEGAEEELHVECY